MQYSLFTHEIISWYRMCKRDLPWRNTTNTYEIWLSEVILQQTRVAQGLPYYQRFVRAFPTVEALAKADEEQVLRLWQGLGYYSRARNLHRCAQHVCEKFDGTFPNKYEELLKLPGVGPYTAAAIASFSFKLPEPVVDGNVYRVLSRVFGIEDDIAGGAAFTIFRKFSENLIPLDQPDTYNQAVMEFGAIHCTPKSPACTACIFEQDCYANINGKQAELPVKSKKTKIKAQYYNYIVVRIGEGLLMKKRSGEGIWEGLYDFHLLKTDKQVKPEALQGRDSLMDFVIDKGTLESGPITYKHILSHRRIFASFYEFDVQPADLPQAVFEKSGLGLYSPEQICALPKPVLVDKYLRENIF